MRAIQDAFYRAKIRQLLQRTLAVQAGLLRIEAMHRRATWRLNEAEATLQRHALGYFWQTFYWPYGSRRNAQDGLSGGSDYLDSLPLEHQGIKSISVDMPFNGNYPVTDYLDRVRQQEAIYSLYRVNWLGQWVRK